MKHPAQRHRSSALLLVGLALLPASALAHGTAVFPASRVYRVFLANPDNPSFPLAASAVAMDGTTSYYTWNEVSRNIPEAVQAGLPPGFDYSPWMPDGEIASAGRVNPNSPLYPRTYAGLDQVSGDWPTTSVTAGETIEVDFHATAVHLPSVWDVWMTTPDWDPSTPLTWDRMEFLGRPSAALVGDHFLFDVDIPADRQGHHVLWIAWHRDDAAGEVFVSASDVFVEDAGIGAAYCVAAPNSVSATGAALTAAGSASVAVNDLTLTAAPVPRGTFGIFLHAPGQAQSPLGDGFLCISGSIVRIPPAQIANAAGEMTQTLDLTATYAQSVSAGVTRHFQGWYRDGGGAVGSNLTHGLEIAFLP